MIWLALIVATVGIQVANFLSIKIVGSDPTFMSSVKVALIMLPLSIVSTVGYAYYYGMGFKAYNYPVLIVAAFVISVTSSFFIQGFLLKNKEVYWFDFISIAVVLIGVSMIIGRDKIAQYLVQ